MEVRRLGVDEGARLREIRLRALLEAPDAFGSTFEETVARPLEELARAAREVTDICRYEGRRRRWRRAVRTGRAPRETYTSYCVSERSGKRCSISVIGSMSSAVTDFK